MYCVVKRLLEELRCQRDFSPRNLAPTMVEELGSLLDMLRGKVVGLKIDARFWRAKHMCLGYGKGGIAIDLAPRGNPPHH